MTPLPTWAFRDLESQITWLMNASTCLADIENDANITKNIRELASEGRTNVKAALWIAREIRSHQEAIVQEHGSEEEQGPSAG